MGKYLQSVIVVFFVLVSALLADSTSARVTPQGDGIKPRTLRDYVTQEKDFYDLIKKKHPVFKSPTKRPSFWYLNKGCFFLIKS